MQRAAISLILGLAFFAQVASAHSTLKCVGPAPVAESAPSLQQILDGLVVSGPPIDANAPIDVELWQNSSGAMTAQLVANYTPDSEGTWFGMYDPDHVNNPAFLISDALTPADVATVSFLDNGSITIQGGPQTGPKLGFEGPFGFFAKNFDPKGIGDTIYFYTQDALNLGNAPRAVVFQGNGSTTLKLPGLAAGLFLPGQFLIAWETGLGDANDGKFNDFLVLVSNIVPVTVPEPAFALLLGISALAVVCGRRARST